MRKKAIFLALSAFECNGRKITGPIGIDTGRVFPRRFRSLLFRVDARGTSPPYFYPLFLLPSSLPPSAPYFIVSRALCPLKRPDYKRPINSFILFARARAPSPLSRPRSRKSSVVIPVRARFFPPFSSVPAVRLFVFYLFHRWRFRSRIVVN